ncbi:hypothetical protein MAL08_16735 [Leptospira noguchii]|uniref:Lipoprotein n=2 Tax=Leptospira noguchii TaxID=28182 RepID=A0ABP2T625_9LEPT|nr:hypothetical protein [Leptospira noguchii]EMM99472.1 hypothetical protein LEP1GSC035_1150 [Leptospira noguchii str. 2007001578]EMO27721.1 hypothetical protein LEP1GSC170_4122 [Leptospira interrogans serovar Bataviae str. HAI135]EKR73997.1 hypothetical protein LEP1GSC041_3236 [Leptospira noguchii str. 2006001870]EMS83040.1 hypothetical protein LEP1GSC073_0466 [Leptospira noguchii str. Cascata]EPE82391.1 hypothetical protein LEP1GSC021_0562 [Leptospira noguchii str. 1993005606]
MRKNILKLVTTCMIILAFNVCKVNDHEEEDDIITLSLVHSLDQSSGNCAFVQKLFWSGGDFLYYYTSFSTKPKKDCDFNKIMGSDLASRKKIIEGNYNKITELANTLHCSEATKTLITDFKNDELTITQTQYDNLRAKIRFFPVSDFRTEAITQLSSSTHPLTSFGFSAEEIKALNRLTVEQGENAGYRELLAAFAEETLDTTCSNALTDSNRSLFPGFYGLDPDANTKAKITGISNNGSASAICTYGGQTVASARCATLNYEY